jgi:D-alanyl-lipoteichoic acid acyltransferase DltB (MBOAT superfamily)
MENSRPQVLESQGDGGEVAAARHTAWESVLRSDLAKLLMVAIQLGLAVLVIGQFQIENRAVHRVSILVLFGFLVHSLLPLRHRLPFFTALSLAATGIVLGPRNTAWLVTLGLGLISICHLPVRFGLRVALLLLSGGILAALRTEWVNEPWQAAVWPILGSMFMFRLIIYMYDLRHEKGERSLWRTLSYFFMLPNVCFALFPVVDYKTFRRTHYNDDAYSIYQVGVTWIARGIFHLLLYRLVYYYCTLAPSEIDSAAGVAQFMVSNFALYLRVSGTFHIIVGMLRLFGFNLPETHFFYFASSSVNDFWRRINIYWKDFMLKVFYHPMFFRLRRGGQARAVVLSTLVVVAATWFLHSYQWFWLRGSFPIHWQDGVFWGVLGVAMIGNSLYEMRHTRARGRRARSWSVQSSLRQGLQITATFTFICVLWSIWTCGSWDEWSSLWSFLDGDSGPSASRGGDVRALLACVLAVGVAVRGGKPRRTRAEDKRRRLFRMAAVTAASLAALYLLGLPRVYTSLGEQVSETVQTLRVAKLNRLDAAQMQRGYYEDLLNVDRFNTHLWEIYKGQPANWLRLGETEVSVRRDDFLLRELAPQTEIVFKGALLGTNEWGMRDGSYTLEKPESTYRIGLVGASYVMGAGVRDGETFETLLEDRLNREGPHHDGIRYEILNFAVGGYSPIQRMMAFEEKALRFDPDAVFYVAHENEIARLMSHLLGSRKEGIEAPYPYLREMFAEAGINADTADATVDQRLSRRSMEILSWTYGRIGEECRRRGITPVWIYLPTLAMHGEPSDIAGLVQLAQQAGFLTIDLFGVYDGHDLFGIRIADWDYHPNPAGHRLIADRLYDELIRSWDRDPSHAPWARPTKNVSLADPPGETQ